MQEERTTGVAEGGRTGAGQRHLPKGTPTRTLPERWGGGGCCTFNAYKTVDGHLNKTVGGPINKTIDGPLYKNSYSVYVCYKYVKHITVNADECARDVGKHCLGLYLLRPFLTGFLFHFSYYSVILFFLLYRSCYFYKRGILCGIYTLCMGSSHLYSLC